VLPKRCANYGVTLHPEKTRLVPFRRPTAPPLGGQSPPQAQPGTFDLLGLRHYWGRSRTGRWVVKRKTAPERFRRTLRRFAPWCRWNRHEPVAEQQRRLGQKLRGH
jgi:RNA-directed DNA polymerase